MGEAYDPMAVLDKRPRVRGTDGLRVIDAAVVPLIPSGTTSEPTTALADRAVALIRNEDCVPACLPA